MPYNSDYKEIVFCLFLVTGPVILGASILGGRKEFSRVSLSLLVCTRDLARAQWSFRKNDLASISCDTVTLWPPVTSATVGVGPGPGSILPEAASLLKQHPSWRCCWLSIWPHPTFLRQVLGSRASCPAGQQHPQPPPCSPALVLCAL